MMLDNESDWHYLPLNNSFGRNDNNVFYATFGSQKAFVKVNASPLLASISQVGLTPKIIQSRRNSNGDMLTFQSWIDGVVLDATEMGDPQVNQTLATLHHSKMLVESFIKFGNQVTRPRDWAETLYSKAHKSLIANSFLSELLDELRAATPAFDAQNAVVVHGDVNHHNWLKNDHSGKIYLVDWDTVALSDAFVDVGHLLSHYIAPTQWREWLDYSGYKIEADTFLKIKWYGTLSFLKQINENLWSDNMQAANLEILGLRHFCNIFK
ncbi:phosphotransferase family protein [Pseudolactococcus insecticola]|uniref:Phosphotransferase n=1 Tax=Pseudolactococcus insecticola TaxID=2709158 RepID=A0A6A0B9H7_9LACT|nr:phosphotransferase family protein [Lactococcus insecticola]GFH41375.1 phosphotransferase [Lactococcus insecticola]